MPKKVIDHIWTHQHVPNMVMIVQKIKKVQHEIEGIDCFELMSVSLRIKPKLFC